MKILVTGAAGFIGMFVSKQLLERGDTVIGVDMLSPVTGEQIKKDRLQRLFEFPGFHFEKKDIADAEAIANVFEKEKPGAVVHLAAQTGVRMSLKDPQSYIRNNISAFVNILELCKTHKIGHLVFASSSSVYGNNEKVPFSTTDPVDHPVSTYAVTKRSTELLAYTYAYNFRLPATCVRLFTVYGPWGRPDMAPFLFTKAILEGKEIRLFNQGDMARDFTYVEDVATAILGVLDKVPHIKEAPYSLYNIGNGMPVRLPDFIRTLESLIGREARFELLPMQDGDVYNTYADIHGFTASVGPMPHTPLEEGLKAFLDWYKSYFRIIPQKNNFK